MENYLEGNPKVLMTTGAETENGVTLTFNDKTEMLKYRMRCYASRKREDERLEKLALKFGIPAELTGWEDLVFLPKKNSLGIECKLWIVKESAKRYGIVDINYG